MKFVFLSKSYVKILRSYKPTYNSRKIILKSANIERKDLYFVCF